MSIISKVNLSHKKNDALILMGNRLADAYEIIKNLKADQAPPPPLEQQIVAEPPKEKKERKRTKPKEEEKKASQKATSSAKNNHGRRKYTVEGPPTVVVSRSQWTPGAGTGGAKTKKQQKAKEAAETASNAAKDAVMSLVLETPDAAKKVKKFKKATDVLEKAAAEAIAETTPPIVQEASDIAPLELPAPVELPVEPPTPEEEFIETDTTYELTKWDIELANKLFSNVAVKSSAVRERFIDLVGAQNKSANKHLILKTQLDEQILCTACCKETMVEYLLPENAPNKHILDKRRWCVEHSFCGRCAVMISANSKTHECRQLFTNNCCYKQV